MRFKGQTAEALSEMGVFEMAETIRRDVIIPENYYDAKALLESLLQIISISIWKRKEWKKESKIWLRSRRIFAVSVYSVVWM